jgi:hypothetical protein
MGSLKAELRRFEKRRLRPILQALKRRRQATDQPSGSATAMEQLLAALIRSELRRTEPNRPLGSTLAAMLHARLVGPQTPMPRDLEALVRTMLATPIPPVAKHSWPDTIAIARAPADTLDSSVRRAP